VDGGATCVRRGRRAEPPNCRNGLGPADGSDSPDRRDNVHRPRPKAPPDHDPPHAPRPLDALLRDNLRVTTPSRTIVDLAATLESRALRDVVERAQDLRRFDPDDIRDTLARAPRRPGTRRLHDLITVLAPDEDNARSHLERLFFALTRKARLPTPVSNHEIGGRSRDFAWPDQRLVVETDGYRYHSSRQAKRRDNRRDRQLTALGWRPVRFTYEEIAFEPGEVARELVRLLRQPALSRNARTAAM
jgi:very-short-patch-repair endonuclease